ncbi:hypothetical protein ABT093_24100 [Kitasatospora sp. NPDC002551]|uniref:hypothetical protein n=1 Tax=unclassified Kitasatospora TaxID=2633591 RepID=UPI003318E197
MPKTFPIKEPFSGSTVPEGWKFSGAAALVEGWLRLVPDKTFQTGTVLLDRAFSSKLGIRVEFDLAAYHDTGSEPPGDGISFFLIDGAKTTGPGGPGGALGYAFYEKGTKPGVTAGYLGIGVDQFGSFSNPVEAGTGGPGQKPNSMVVRGSGDGNNGFDYLTGADLPHDLSLTRQAPARVHLTILDGKVTAGFRPPGGVQKLIADFQIPHGTGQEPLPDTLKLGLSAATGGSTSNYVVRNLVISLPLASSQKLRSTAYQDGGKYAYPYEFTLTAGQADVRRWSFSFDVPQGATVKKDSGAWYTVVQDGSNGVVEISSPDDESHVVFANKSLSIDITVDYPDKNDTHNTVANLLAQQNE